MLLILKSTIKFFDQNVSKTIKITVLMSQGAFEASGDDVKSNIIYDVVRMTGN